MYFGWGAAAAVAQSKQLRSTLKNMVGIYIQGFEWIFGCPFCLVEETENHYYNKTRLLHSTAH